MNPFKDFHGTPSEFIDLISDEWNFQYGDIVTTEVLDKDLRAYGETRCITGGWSENEEVQAALEETLFHLQFWWSSHRGGLTVYRVPKDWLDVDGKWGSYES